jgi:hypothetical protein
MCHSDTQLLLTSSSLERLLSRSNSFQWEYTPEVDTSAAMLACLTAAAAAAGCFGG